MKLSVCTDAVFMGKDIAKAAGKVKELGIPAIEFWTWKDKDPAALRQIHEASGSEIAAFCTDFISLVDAPERGRYIEALKETIDAAKSLGCRRIISQTGSELPIEREKQHQSLVEGLKACVPYLEAADMTLVVEPLNLRVDHAGYYLSSSDEAARMIREVGSEHVKMLFDIYHQQITEGDLIRRIREYITSSYISMRRGTREGTSCTIPRWITGAYSGQFPRQGMTAISGWNISRRMSRRRGFSLRWR